MDRNMLSASSAFSALLRIIAAVTAAACLCNDAAAQFRGDEMQDRPYDLDDRYFLSQLSFSRPWRWERVYDERKNAYRMELGSIATDEFYIGQEAKLTAEPADWLTIRFLFEQKEDWDGRYARHRIEVGGPKMKPAAAASFEPYAFAELDPFKEWIDLGLGLRCAAEGYYEGFTALTIVDWVMNEKAKRGEGRYEKLPYSLRHRSTLVFRPLLAAVTYDAELDFPLILTRTEERFRFWFHRFRHRVEAVWEPAENFEVRFEIAAEWAYKKWDYDAFAADSPGTGWFRRDTGEARIEAVRVFGRCDGFEETLTAGFHWKQMLERWTFPNDPWRDRKLWKRDFIAYAGWKFILATPFYVNLILFGGNLEHYDQRCAHRDDDWYKLHPVAVKVDFYLGLWFGKGMEIAGLLSFEPDLMEFGGGGCTAIFSF